MFDLYVHAVWHALDVFVSIFIWIGNHRYGSDGKQLATWNICCHGEGGRTNSTANAFRLLLLLLLLSLMSCTQNLRIYCLVTVFICSWWLQKDFALDGTCSTNCGPSWSLLLSLRILWRLFFFLWYGAMRCLASWNAITCVIISYRVTAAFVWSCAVLHSCAALVVLYCTDKYGERLDFFYLSVGCCRNWAAVLVVVQP